MSAMPAMPPTTLPTTVFTGKSESPLPESEAGSEGIGAPAAVLPLEPPPPSPKLVVVGLLVVEAKGVELRGVDEVDVDSNTEVEGSGEKGEEPEAGMESEAGAEEASFDDDVVVFERAVLLPVPVVARAVVPFPLPPVLPPPPFPLVGPVLAGLPLLGARSVLVLLLLLWVPTEPPLLGKRASEADLANTLRTRGEPNLDDGTNTYRWNCTTLEKSTRSDGVKERTSKSPTRGTMTGRWSSLSYPSGWRRGATGCHPQMPRAEKVDLDSGLYRRRRRQGSRRRRRWKPRLKEKRRRRGRRERQGRRRGRMRGLKRRTAGRVNRGKWSRRQQRPHCRRCIG